jgi:hypothetical protein
MSGDLQAIVTEASKAFSGVKRTHCKQGHPFTPENTITENRSDGSVVRECRTCRAIRTARYKAQQAIDLDNDPNHLANVAGLDRFIAARRARGIPKEGIAE